MPEVESASHQPIVRITRSAGDNRRQAEVDGMLNGEADDEELLATAAR